MKYDKTLLLVANYDSGVGYAWWLMESFWVRLAEQYHHHNQVVLAYPAISKLPNSITSAPIQVIELDFSGCNVHQILAQCKFLLHNQVHTIYFSDMPMWHWRYVLYRLAGVKIIIIHEHTPGVRTPVRGIKAVLKRLLHRLPWFVVDGAIGATDFVQQRFIEVCCMPAKRCFSAPNGLPLLNVPTEPAELHQIFSIPEEKKILVMTGRAHRYKRVDFVLECMSALFAAGCNKIHFLFIGDGPDLSYFKTTAAKLGIANNCTFAGRRNDVPNLLEGADIAIHPSLGEVGYSLSILEYMRAGLPVVVPDNPSVCGATKHNVTGIIYPEGDLQAASEALHKLVKDDSMRTKIGKNARLSAKGYNLETTWRALMAAFSKIDRQGNLLPK